MLPISRLCSFAAPALLLGLFAGCADGARQSDSQTRSSMSGGSSSMMDMQSMCEMHKMMMAGKPTAEHQAMMQEHMKSMTPDKREKMQKMMEQCK
ncbi:MAG: hypothetical protein M3150_02710 [Pseudomonadota bacterium]|nr:hypothetical protein [Pseudomonadota bacterium]